MINLGITAQLEQGQAKWKVYTELLSKLLIKYSIAKKIAKFILDRGKGQI